MFAEYGLPLTVKLITAIGFFYSLLDFNAMPHVVVQFVLRW
jgi:hypothetical protein